MNTTSGRRPASAALAALKRHRFGQSRARIAARQLSVTASDILARIAGDPDILRIPEDETTKNLIKELTSFAGGRSFQGVFGRLRMSDLPRIGDNHGAEEDIALDEDQGLIEKNYFLFDRRRQLLTWQINRSASTTTRFAEYLSRHVSKR
jgi:hypothetical protein